MAFAVVVKSALRITRLARQFGSRYSVCGAVNGQHREAMLQIRRIIEPDIVDERHGIAEHVLKSGPGNLLAGFAQRTALWRSATVRSLETTEKGPEIRINAVRLTIGRPRKNRRDE